MAIGARMPLVAYNVNLGTANLEIASSIAKKIRFIGGGLRYCKAMGVELKERGIVQVSINRADYTRAAFIALSSWYALRHVAMVSQSSEARLLGWFRWRR